MLLQLTELVLVFYQFSHCNEYDGSFLLQVITSLPPPDCGAELSYYKLHEQMDLLKKVLYLQHFVEFFLYFSQDVISLFIDPP